MSHADYAERSFGGAPPLLAGEVVQHRSGPLQYAPRVAAGGRRHADAAPAAVLQVDVVEADGCRGDEADARAVEQRRIAARAGTDNEGVGVADVGGRDDGSGEPAHLGPGVEDPFEEGDGAVDDDFSMVVCLR